MPTKYKYAAHVMTGTMLVGAGVGVYFAYLDRIFKKDKPGSDFKDKLEHAKDQIEQFFQNIKDWLDDRMGTGHPGKPPGEPGTPDPTIPDSSVSQASFSSSHQDNGSSIGHALSHVPVELWALIAIGLAIVAIGYHCYGNQHERKPSPSMRR